MSNSSEHEGHTGSEREKHLSHENLETIKSKISPVSFVLMPVAQGMLIMGSHMTKEDCSFPLPDYLIIAGAVSLGLGTMGVISPQILQVIKKKNKNRTELSKASNHVIELLKWLSRLMMFVQVGILIAGWGIILPNIGGWQTTDKLALGYCESGPVIFIIIYLTISGLFILLGLLTLLYMKNDS